MDNNQFYLIIGVPTFTVILAWLSNRADINRLSDKLDANVAKLNERIDKLTESHHKDIENLMESHHKDNVALMGYMVPLHERMAKLEPRN